MVVAIVFIIRVKMDVLKAPGHMNFQATEWEEAWRRWEQQFRTYFTACEITRKSNNVQVAILLHAAGPETKEIHSHFSFATSETKDN